MIETIVKVVLWGLCTSPFAWYISSDGRERRAPQSQAWIASGLLFGPLSLPFWWAKRPLKEGEFRSRSTLMAIIKGFGYLWAYLMGAWMLLNLVVNGFTEKALWMAVIIGIVGIVPLQTDLLWKPLVLIGVTTTDETVHGPTGPLKEKSKAR